MKNSSTRDCVWPLGRLVGPAGFWMGASLLSLVACTQSSGSSSAPPTVQGDPMVLQVMSNGFGPILPHQILALDALGNPTGQIAFVRDQYALIENLTLSNPILPVSKFPTQPILPTGAAGNHFLYATFNLDIDLDTVLDGSPGGGVNSGLTGSVVVTGTDAITGAVSLIQGRVLVGGKTYASNGVGGSTLSTWVRTNASGDLELTDARGLGFPGTETVLFASNGLVSERTLVFIPDADDDLSTHETFPAGLQINMRISSALMSMTGEASEMGILGSTSVGSDMSSPELKFGPPPLNTLSISPGNGDVDVDPFSHVIVDFTEPIQPLTLGPLEGASPAGDSLSFGLRFGPVTGPASMPFTMRPVSVFDLSRFEIIPAFPFPGKATDVPGCHKEYSQVDVTLNAGHVADLALNPLASDPQTLVPNRNTLSGLTFFELGAGQGLVNAPVLPDAIFVMGSGSAAGLSVIDLNGFGQGTGDPTSTPGVAREGESKFQFNPNVSQQTGILPPLQLGTCTLDGGSAGVFTLTLDTTLDGVLLQTPLIARAGDMHVGRPLDTVFNNALATGCQSGGPFLAGDAAAADGLKVAFPTAGGPNTVAPGPLSNGGNTMPGSGNAISWAPHPNPPPLQFPPLCLMPFLMAQEPTTVDHIHGPLPPFGSGNNQNAYKTNLLVPGDPFGTPLDANPTNPSGLLVQEQNGFFMGPSYGQVLTAACNLYQVRQQLGQFCYLVDRQRGEVVVLNSNRMQVIDRIAMEDPTSLAIGPNLDVLAVSSQATDKVFFVDIDPSSATFHQIIQQTLVGDGPRGVAWQPEGEDLLVCNELGDSLSIIAGSSLEVRSEVSMHLSAPFEVCVFPRMTGFAFDRGVYLAYVLNRDGRVAIFESGPGSSTGWGYDNIVGLAPMTFQNPKTIQPDPSHLQAGAWVVHEGPLDPVTHAPGPVGEGALSHLFLEASPQGPIPLGGQASTPQMRGMQMGIRSSVGSRHLSGIPVDVAFDNQRNLGVLPGWTTDFSPDPALQNGKGLVRLNLAADAVVPISAPQFLFAVVPDSGNGVDSAVIDVIRMDPTDPTAMDVNPYQPGRQSIEAPHATALCDYWRQ
ncbi:MAG: hypothetical protein P1V35_03410 [Planctomycetota bacterium]|nr:hypothetical protein [Planctomycetota bacterium]